MPEWEERPYQQAAIQAACHDLWYLGVALLVMPTGAGKAYVLSVIAGRIIRAFSEVRVLIPIEGSKLVEQLHETFLQVNPDLTASICCKTLRSRCDYNAPCIIGTRQSVWPNIHELRGIGLIIADEAHTWPLVEEKEGPKHEFSLIHQELKRRNPNLRLLGCTATDYNRYGYIHGPLNKKGFIPYYPKVSYKCTYKELFEAGKLIKPTFKIVDSAPEADWSRIEAEHKEDFNTIDLSKYNIDLERPLHEFIDNHAQWCKHILVFAPNTETSDRWALSLAGAVSIHSKQGKKKADQNLKDFEAGKYRIGVTVLKFCIGFDFKPADCCILAAKYNAVNRIVQMIGRPMRISPETGKTRCLVGDLVRNVDTAMYDFDLDKPKVKVPGVGSRSGGVPTKDCPGLASSIKGSCCDKCRSNNTVISNTDSSVSRSCKDCGFIEIDKNVVKCENEVHFACMACPECGYIWTQETVDALLPNLITHEHGEREPNILVNVREWKFKLHMAGSGKKMMKVIIYTDHEHKNKQKINQFFMFNDHYKGNRIVNKCTHDWKVLGGGDYPESVDEAEFVFCDLMMPEKIEIRKNGKYFNVVNYIMPKKEMVKNA